LLPAVGVVVSVIVWGALTWAGIDQAEVWMWLVSLAAGLFAVLGAVLYLPKHRARVDAAPFETLNDPRHAGRAALGREAELVHAAGVVGDEFGEGGFEALIVGCGVLRDVGR